MHASDPALPAGPPGFSTDAYRPAERFDAFHEEYARRFMGLDIDASGEEAFAASVQLQPIGPLICARLETTPISYARSRQRLRDGDDALVLNIHTRGRARLEQHEFRADSGSDFATVISNARPGGGQFAGQGLAIRIPEAVLAPRLPPGTAFSPVAVKHGGPLAHLLSGYVAAFAGLGPGAPAELGDLVAEHMLDLVAVAFGVAGDRREQAEAGGIRAARRQAVLDEIGRHFAAPDFGPGQVTARLGISERYLRQLLEESGTSFSALVLERRLQWARQRLLDRREAQRIADIAYDVGFSDLSYFNRSFRRRFGATPSEVRGEAAATAVTR